MAEIIKNVVVLYYCILKYYILTIMLRIFKFHPLGFCLAFLGNDSDTLIH